MKFFLYTFLILGAAYGIFGIIKYWINRRRFQELAVVNTEHINAVATLTNKNREDVIWTGGNNYRCNGGYYIVLTEETPLASCWKWIGCVGILHVYEYKERR